MADSHARVRVFSDDGKCVSDALLMRRALEYVKAFDGVIAQHAQEPRLTEDAQMNEGELSGVLGLRGWPAVAEEAIIARDILLDRTRRLAVACLSRVDRRFGRTHPLGESARRQRHRRGDAAPPAAHRRAAPRRTTRSTRSIRRCAAATTSTRVRAGLADGTIDAVATDHAPHALEDKETEWQAASPGMLGLETALSVVALTMVETGQLDWAGVADRMSVRPARIGRLAGQGQPIAVGGPGQPGARRPGRASRRRPAGARLEVAQHALRRSGAAGAGRAHVPAGHGPRFSTGSPHDRRRRERRAVAGARRRPHVSRRRLTAPPGETFGEAVFATGMTGYQETLTDPSYHKQVVVMTTPHIGNTGVNDEDGESSRIWVVGYVVRDPARVPSNWRSKRALGDELAAQNIVGYQRHRYPRTHPPSA